MSDKNQPLSDSLVSLLMPRTKSAVGGGDMRGRAAAVKTVWQSATIKEVPRAFANHKWSNYPGPVGPYKQNSQICVSTLERVKEPLSS